MAVTLCLLTPSKTRLLRLGRQRRLLPAAAAHGGPAHNDDLGHAHLDPGSNLDYIRSRGRVPIAAGGRSAAVAADAH